MCGLKGVPNGSAGSWIWVVGEQGAWKAMHSTTGEFTLSQKEIVMFQNYPIFK